MKTSKLIGPALDWAVAKCEGYVFVDNGEILKCFKDGKFFLDWYPEEREDVSTFAPSLHWAQAGPIIERERFHLANNYKEHPDSLWQCVPESQNPQRHIYSFGATPLIAAMRCYVASKLGDEVDIPEELLS